MVVSIIPKRVHKILYEILVMIESEVIIFNFKLELILLINLKPNFLVLIL
jgi:hypothetical protein